MAGERDMYRKIKISTEKDPNLADLRYLVEHQEELGVPDAVSIRLVRRNPNPSGPFGATEPGIILEWWEEAP